MSDSSNRYTSPSRWTATGWHPASWREPDARPADLLTPRVLDRPGRRGRAGPAGLRHHRGRPGAAVRRPVGGRRPHRPGPRPAGRRADRRPGRAAHPAHRPRADGGRHPHRAVPPVQGHRHAGLRQHRAGGRPRAGRHQSGLPRLTSARRTVGDHGRARTTARDCSTRPPTTSRCCAGCGTAGRTTPRSATSPPGGSSTGTSCTTSTSRARFSVKGPSITPRPPQGQPIVAALGHGEPVLRADRAQRRRRLRDPARRRARSTDIVDDHRVADGPRVCAPVRVFADLVVFLERHRGRGRSRDAPDSTSRAGTEYRQ